MARVAATKREPILMNSVEAQVREYKHLKDQIDALSKEQKRLRDDLMTLIENTGFEDDQGHWWLELDDEYDGVTSLQRQRRVSRSLDEESAKEILDSHGLWNLCTKTVEVVDEDAVMRALWDEKLTEEDVDNMYATKITWALTLK